ncbi:MULTISPECIES: NUDIX hydrolase [unclassified Streptococcus]|uniref:NUDIX hydrolase n=1 Tax=unclassified Streptococcus TaxID=2608887 RepID=UPI001071B959|nr:MULTISPECIES: NUDIX hydrolase [unclassified Streptococcus]MBF0787186.1 NUDIX hydrolase [Streptococcus sp. 19428wC2_LYSM12]MCQ9212098.1 NUDIX hydrolase [Streptococcus sp. B01]MCQ9213427.1 NUDIX hydrolase [Streptococcus sp. O1]TFV05935.1 NUDIX hydrolase [Streptococcus sp. LYSM12]
MKFEEKTIKRTEVFKGHIFDVVVDDVALPMGGEAKRELIFHKGAVCVLAVTPDDQLILVKQYRKAIEQTSYEIPAGKLEVGENADPEAAALRELEEETGYTGDLELLYDFYSAIGFCNERLRLYVATNLVKVANPRPMDDDEVIEVYHVSLEEAYDLIASGDICDAKTIIAIQQLQLMRK